MLLLAILACTPPAPAVDTGCDLAYQQPRDPRVLEEQYARIPAACETKIDDPRRGPRCRSLVRKSLDGYFGRAAQAEAVRIYGEHPAFLEDGR